jgi:hypothetical protein
MREGWIALAIAVAALLAVPWFVLYANWVLGR